MMQIKLPEVLLFTYYHIIYSRFKKLHPRNSETVMSFVIK